MTTATCSCGWMAFAQDYSEVVEMAHEHYHQDALLSFCADQPAISANQITYLRTQAHENAIEQRWQRYCTPNQPRVVDDSFGTFRGFLTVLKMWLGMILTALVVWGIVVMR